MSGKVSDNVGRGSGLVKAASTAPDSGSANPATNTNPDAVGARFINTTSGEMFICSDATAGSNVWKGQLGSTVEPPTWLGDRGVFCGSDVGSASNVIEYINITSAGNSTDFGDMTAARYGGSATSNGTRLVYSGGFDYSVVCYNVIQYLTIGTTGNMSDFGDLTVCRTYCPAGASNETIGMCMGGHNGVSAAFNTVDKFNIASTGNATDFGDLSAAKYNGGGCSNGTRALYSGGDT